MTALEALYEIYNEKPTFELMYLYEIYSMKFTQNDKSPQHLKYDRMVISDILTERGY